VIEQRTVRQVLDEYGPAVRRKFEPIAKRASVAWPPASITVLAFKSEKVLEVWAKDASGVQKRLASYPILAASGGLGPKRKEGDKQVPEGFYKLPVLNPNSRYHLSIMVDYPNAEDIAHKTVPRSEMGGEIFVHGNQVSIGCIAIGDRAIEEVFCLAAWAKNREIIISPIDFRTDRMARLPTGLWVTGLYGRIAKRLQDF
jgi:murein L,D-transpeptidase YafK